MKLFLKPADILFGAISVVLITVSFLMLSDIGGSEARAVIKVKDSEYVYPLDQNRDIVLEGVLGEAHLTVKDNHIQFVNSPCRDKICIHMGEAAVQGDYLACLPNRVIVTVEGGKVGNTDR